MFEAIVNVTQEIFSVSSISDIIELIPFIIIIIGFPYIIFVYYFNKYYTNKHKNDFFYLFWGYTDTENKMSADKHLSLFIYHFFHAYQLNSYKFFNKKYKFFPENIKDMDPKSFMPNATKENLEKFKKKHIKWMKFNIVSQYAIILLGVVCFSLIYLINFEIL